MSTLHYRRVHRLKYDDESDHYRHRDHESNHSRETRQIGWGHEGEPLAHRANLELTGSRNLPYPPNYLLHRFVRRVVELYVEDGSLAFSAHDLLHARQVDILARTLAMLNNP